MRNKDFFKGAEINWLGFRGRVCQVILDNSIRIKGHMYNTLDGMRILNYFKVQHRSSKISTHVEACWSPPEQGEL